MNPEKFSRMGTGQHPTTPRPKMEPWRDDELRDRLAMSAPAVPFWFRPEQLEEVRFFSWPWFYADNMLKARGV